MAGEIPGYTMEKRYLTKAGRRSGSRCRSRWSAIADGSPRHFISQIEDISERKHAQARLQQAEFELAPQRDYAQAIISAMHDGYALTVGGEIKVVNERAVRADRLRRGRAGRRQGARSRSGRPSGWTRR